jgi:hypothetical protein
LDKYCFKIKGVDFNLLLSLIYQTVFDNPADRCIIKGKREDWIGLPKDKSLFFAKKNCGLPIGNLTSQLFSNVYLNDFDYFMKYQLGCCYYGRYVDDFFVVSRNKIFLKEIIKRIDFYLKKQLGLKLHPKKVYLQHFSKGVDFLGGYIKPHRNYLRRKNKGKIFKELNKYNALIREKKGRISREEKMEFYQKLNSYLGLAGNFKTGNLRKKIKDEVSGYWFNYIYFTNYNKKVKLKRK